MKNISELLKYYISLFPENDLKLNCVLALILQSVKDKDKFITEAYLEEFSDVDKTIKNLSLNIDATIDKLRNGKTSDYPLNQFLSTFDEDLITADLFLKKSVTDSPEEIKDLIVRTENAEMDFVENRKKELANMLFGSKGKKTAPISQAKEQDKTLVPEEKNSTDTALTHSEEKDLFALMKKTEEIKAKLSSVVFGQNHAINALVTGLFKAEMIASSFENRDKPKATFLFAGPPGVGKTFLSEQAAKALGLPFLRLDMSNYSSHNAIEQIAGLSNSYTGSKKGELTGFVDDNPRCVILLDEIEKANLSVIHLLLQLLDAARLKDNYMSKEVSFTDAILILTTNAGKVMYEDEDINLSGVSAKSVLKAISSEISPMTGEPVFPAAICSRFSAGNVVMFNRMSADYLLQIAQNELEKNRVALSAHYDLELEISKKIPYALLFSSGVKVDARAIKGKSANFLYSEIFEALHLVNSKSNDYNVNDIKKIKIDVDCGDDRKIAELFDTLSDPNVLIFGDKQKTAKFISNVKSANCLVASTQEEAQRIIEENDLALILCDLGFDAREERTVLNIEDLSSAGNDFFEYALKFTSTPVYLLADDEKSLSTEEQETLYTHGAKGVVYTSRSPKEIDSTFAEIINAAYLQGKLLELGKSNKVLFYNAAQKMSDDNTAEIYLSSMKLITAIDADENDNVVTDLTKPNVRFTDVIGAKDAKEELRYFINFLKSPVKFMKNGVKPPKGILLYGPPGTGKTLLAKAMAGESDVTFISTEGNQFLKKYVGEGAASLHSVFKIARKYAPSILFIDEIDAFAKPRGGLAEESHTDDVLTAFLSEMDGFVSNPSRPVFVLAATNKSIRTDGKAEMDPAFIRRFDRKILVDLPSLEERKQFILMKIKKIKYNRLSEEQIETIANRSVGMSLADLDSVIEFAQRNVIRSSTFELTDEVLDDAFETVIGGEKRAWKDAEVLRTARHEAGHTVVSVLLGEIPEYLTIVSRGDHGGYMQRSSNEEKGVYTKHELMNMVAISLGGRAAEILYYGRDNGITTGSSADLAHATETLHAMITKYGMDETLLSIDNVSNYPNYANDVLKKVDKLLVNELERAISLLSDNKNAIDALVKKLLVQNSLKSCEIAEVLKDIIKQ